MQRFGIAVCLWAVLGIAFGQVPPAQNQFGPAAAPPHGITLDTVKGEIVNFETIMPKPICVTSDGAFVLVANEADARMVVLDQNLALVTEVPLGLGIAAIAERPGGAAGAEEIWVSLRHQMGVAVVSTTDWTVTQFLRPPINAAGVGARAADSPGGIAFKADGSKAYVAASYADRLVVYDAAAKTYLSKIKLNALHNGRRTFMNEPLAVAEMGGFIYVTSYRSGNGTIAESGGPLPEPTNQMKHPRTDPLDARSLPDFDVAKVDTNTDAVVGMIKGVGTVLNGVGFVPSQNLMIVPNLDAQNTLVGEASHLEGRVMSNRLTIIDVTGSSSNNYVVTEDLSPGSDPWANVVAPHDIAVDSANRIYTAGYGSKNIGVFSTSGAFLGEVPAEEGPMGLAYSATTDRLYCWNRASASVTSYDTSSGVPTAILATYGLFDPTWDRVKAGRKVFLDASHSMRGTTSCASCHQHLRTDGTAWDLSKYHDPEAAYTANNAPQFWKDRKGIMQTQSLMSLETVPGFHWRGEQKDLEDFKPAFVGLLKGSIPDDDQFALLKDYVFSAHYRSNPTQMMNRDFSAVAADGIDGFVNDVAVGGDLACGDCHALPTGTDSDITDRFIGLSGAANSTKTAHLRGFWNKASAIAVVDQVTGQEQPMTGTGFLHDGTVNSVEHFMDRFFDTVPRKAQITAYLHEFDSGVAPAANHTEFLDANNPTAGSFLVDQALAGNCGVAVQGVYWRNNQWNRLGLYFDPTLAKFVPSNSFLPKLTLAGLQASVASSNARWMIMGVPYGSEKRVGVDRDRDGSFDIDEVLAGTDPANPDSDGDGIWDGEPASTVAPVVSDLIVDWENTNAIKITYRTDALSPTHVEWGKAGGALNRTAGDPFPLPTGAANDTNHWKRLHTVVLRLTEENTAYDYRILTQGQNNVTGQHTTQTTSTRADSITPSMIVTAVTLTATQTATTTDWTAIVTITDDHGVPLSGALVTGMFTTLTAAVPTGQQAVAGTAPTDAAGVTTVTLSVPAQGTGDGMAFDLPMSIAVGGANPGSSFRMGGGSTRRPKWSESLELGALVIF